MRLPDHSRGPRRERREPLQGAIRRAWVALAVPALLCGCAHPPATKPAPEQAAAAPEKRVFRVGPSADAQRRMDTHADTPPELSESFSSTAIIEHILSQQKDGAAAKPIEPPVAGREAQGSARTAGRERGEAPVRSRSRQAAKAGGIKLAAAPAAKKPRDYWDTVRGRLVLAGVEHDLVNGQIERLQSHPGAVNFLMKRAEPYLQYLLEEINRQKLPTDLIIVPMVESAFETTALSPKEAAGIWQFIPSTGQRYGLEVSETFDARYDMHAATQAAFKYLKHLNRLFDGDWMLAFAAYNAGEGAVQRAIEASRKAGLSGGFWDLKLPAETQAYVLKILSLARVIADPEGYGLKPQKSGGTTYLTRVEVEPGVRIPDLIAASGMAPEEFYKLNPVFKPEVEPPAKPLNLLMPADKARTLAASLAGAKVYGMVKVVVKKGETLSILAKRHGVTELKLAEWNNLSPKAQLKPGQELVVYSA